MKVEIDTRITPALHPMTVTAMEDYGPDVALVLEPTERAFANAYQSIKKCFDAREAARLDPTLNESAQVLKVDDLARTILPTITREFDSVRGRLEQGIASIEKELSAPITATAAHSVASEIRAHVKDLPAGERLAFVRAAIASGDLTSASSVLGAPPYLSGLDKEMQTTLTRMLHEQASPTMSRRLKAMTAAKELIENNAGKVFLALDSAVGHVEVRSDAGLVIRRITPKELREKKAHSDRAFAVRAVA